MIPVSTELPVGTILQPNSLEVDWSILLCTHILWKENLVLLDRGKCIVSLAVWLWWKDCGRKVTIETTCLLSIKVVSQQRRGALLKQCGFWHRGIGLLRDWWDWSEPKVWRHSENVFWRIRLIVQQRKTTRPIARSKLFKPHLLRTKSLFVYQTSKMWDETSPGWEHILNGCIWYKLLTFTSFLCKAPKTFNSAQS